MLSLIKRVMIFLTFFLVFGLLGVALDLLTGGKYAIRVTLEEGRQVASLRVRAWLNTVKRGWVFSPVLFLGFVISPVLFIFAFLVYIVDSYRAYQVYYSDDGKRIVYPSRNISDADVIASGSRTGWLSRFFGPGQSGFIYMGKAMPDNFKLYVNQTPLVVAKAKELGWRMVTIQGQDFLAPPLEDPTAALEDFEVDE